MMKTKVIYLVYRTDEWHSLASRELVYIGEDMEDIIAQLIVHRGMTEDDAKAIRCILQTQCNNRIQDLASELNVENVLKFVGHSYKLERELKNPLDTASQFYLSAETDQTYAEESVELMRWIENLEVGSKIYVGGIIDFHF